MSTNWRESIIQPKELIQWVHLFPDATFNDLWENTDITDPIWLPHLAQAGGATRQQLISASCSIARPCLTLIPEIEDQDKLRIALETAEAWCRGEVSKNLVRTARKDIGTIPYGSADLSYAAKAICTATCAITAKAEHTYSASFSAAHTAYFALQAGVDSKLMCATIRKHFNFVQKPREKRLTLWQRLAIDLQ